MMKIGKHMLAWVATTVIVACVAIPAVFITDVSSLDGSSIQRAAAGIVIATICMPGNILPMSSIPNTIQGPIGLVWSLALWGIVGGELILLIGKLRFIVTKKENANNRGEDIDANAPNHHS